MGNYFDNIPLPTLLVFKNTYITLYNLNVKT